jgi:modulator of FtsH protease
MVRTRVMDDAAAQEGRARSDILFAQTMALVGITSGFFALGGYLGRDASSAWAWLWFVAALGLLIGLRFAVARSEPLALTLLFAFGLICGLGLAPTIAYYMDLDQRLVWQCGVASGLFVAGCGVVGVATRRDLSGVARTLLWVLAGLIVFGVFDTLAGVESGSLLYVIVGLVCFAGLTMFDFQRLARSDDIASAPAFAVSIFVDLLNVVLLLFSGFGGGNR